MNSWNLFVNKAKAIASSAQTYLGNSQNLAQMHINNACIICNMSSGFNQWEDSC